MSDENAEVQYDYFFDNPATGYLLNIKYAVNEGQITFEIKDGSVIRHH